MYTQIPLAVRPSHIPAELERDFDIYDIATVNEDWHLNLKNKLHTQGMPDLFWTPRNSGHWVVARAHLSREVLSNNDNYSSRSIVVIPELNPDPPFAPLQIDPPEHAKYRALLAPALTPKAVASLGIKARALAIELIENFKAKGECEFVGDFGYQLPIAIFMQIANIPLTDRDRLLAIADSLVRADSSEKQLQGHIQLREYAQQKIQERRANPGEDIISTLTQANIDSKPLPDHTLIGMITLLLTAGLDTVANMLGFFALFMAQNPDYRKQLINNPEKIATATEELLRRHPIAQLAREVAQDCTLDGVQLHQGERVLCPAIAFGLDDQHFENADHVDFDRKDKLHETFGDGAHRCMGSMLARVELKVFLEEWLQRIPDFSVKPGCDIQVASASVAGIRELHLIWGKR